MIEPVSRNSEAFSDILLMVKGGMRFTFPPYDLVGKGAVEIGTAIVPVGVVAR